MHLDGFLNDGSNWMGRLRERGSGNIMFLMGGRDFGGFGLTFHSNNVFFFYLGLFTN